MRLICSCMENCVRVNMELYGEFARGLICSCMENLREG